MTVDQFERLEQTTSHPPSELVHVVCSTCYPEDVLPYTGPIPPGVRVAALCGYDVTDEAFADDVAAHLVCVVCADYVDRDDCPRCHSTPRGPST